MDLHAIGSPRYLRRDHYRRARVACLSCRRRKVRCDAMTYGRPCTNCRLDNHDCTTRPKSPRISRQVSPIADVDQFSASHSSQEEHAVVSTINSQPDKVSDLDANNLHTSFVPADSEPLQVQKVPNPFLCSSFHFHPTLCKHTTRV